jgi:hypothetical protein
VSPEDVILRLNYFLDQVEYYPNRDQNMIHLPGRPGYLAFWQAIDSGKPLQMHIGNHDESFFGQCRALIARLTTLLTDPDICEDMDLSEFKDELLKMVSQAENYAFIMLASNAAPWRLHPKHEPVALKLYAMPGLESLQTPTGDVVAGYGGRTDIKAGVTWPNPPLDVGPF